MDGRKLSDLPTAIESDDVIHVQVERFDTKELEDYLKLINSALTKFERSVLGRNNGILSQEELAALHDVAKRGREEYRRFLRHLQR